MEWRAGALEDNLDLNSVGRKLAAVTICGCLCGMFQK